MKRLTARHEVEGVLFGHVLPCLDPTDVRTAVVRRAGAYDRPGGGPQFRGVLPPADVRRALPPLVGRDAPTARSNGPGKARSSSIRAMRYLIVIAAVCDGLVGDL